MSRAQKPARGTGPAARRDFLVVPWENNFLRALLDTVLEDCAGDAGRAVFIFPHSRPERYLIRLLSLDARVPKPLLLPRFHTIDGLFALLSRRITGLAAREAGLLDRVGLLLEAARAQDSAAALFQARPEIPAAGEGPGGGPDDARRFFPWGVRLAGLFEECFSQNLSPGDMPHMEGQVAPFAASLLQRLSGIHARYAAGLAAREWTTPGRNAALTAGHLAAGKALPEVFAPGSVIFIAGFHALTRSEDILLRRLWEECGARVLLHADREAASGGGHWSCALLRDWAARWQARLVLKGDAPARAVRLRLVQGFDLHSQLAVLSEELARVAEEDSEHDAPTVVALPDTGLLLPALHHIPGAECNISMGYPLARSPLFRLIDSLLRLQEGRRDRGYYWRDLVELFRHPYLRMLGPAAPEPGQRRALARLEQALRASGLSYPDPFALLEESLKAPQAEDTPQASALTRHILETALSAFENPATPAGMAAALEGLCRLLLSHGRPLWDRFPIDAECLYRLTRSAIPELARSYLSGENFSPAALFALTRQLLEAERVPFEADPLVGVQVMGMLETRLLTFRTIILMEATEDQLPGLPEGDPLLPDVLRPELGLPPAHTREQTAAYHFFRLLAGAEQALLLWQENPEAPGLQDGRKKKSRFVEELLWREECRRKRLLASHGRDGPLLVLENSVAPPALRSSAIPVVPALRALVRKLLDRPVSASLLDAYLRCPRQFFHERLVRLAPVAEVAEGEDPPATGRLLHAALQEYYTSLLGADLPAGKDLSPKRLRLAHQALLAAFRGQPDYADLRRRLPADAFAMLDAAADIRLLHYIQSQPATRPLALEIPLAASFPFQDSALTLAGAADRLDLRPFIPARGGREGLGLHILDYKTGRPAAPARGLWRDSSLWSRLDSWRPEEGNALLNELAERLRSVQLPLYLLLFSLARSQGGLPPPLDALPDPDDLDAAWIPLGQGGEETALFASRMSPDERQEIIQKRIPALVRFLLRHLTEISGFSPRPGPHCDWCFSRTLCTLR